MRKVVVERTAVALSGVSSSGAQAWLCSDTPWDTNAAISVRTQLSQVYYYYLFV